MAGRATENNELTMPQPWPTPPVPGYQIVQPPIQRTVVRGQTVQDGGKPALEDQGEDRLSPGPPPSAPYQKRIIPPSAEIDCEICKEPNTWRTFYRCSTCGQTGCGQCVSVCADCKVPQCDKCLKTQPCSKFRCRKCGRKGDKKECPECGQDACVHCVYYCRDCTKEQCDQCFGNNGPCCPEMEEKVQQHQEQSKSECTGNSYEFISDPGPDSPESLMPGGPTTPPRRDRQQDEAPELFGSWEHKPRRYRFPENHSVCNRRCPHCMNTGVRSYCTLMKTCFHDQHSCQKCGGFVDLTHYELDEDWEQCEEC